MVWFSSYLTDTIGGAYTITVEPIFVTVLFVIRLKLVHRFH